MKTSHQTAFTGAEEARRQSPATLAAAATGQITIITRHGREIAAGVPAAAAKFEVQPSLLPMTGSGRNFCGNDSSLAIDQLRDEWNRRSKRSSRVDLTTSRAACDFFDASS